jgi:hypothetical protein
MRSVKKLGFILCLLLLPAVPGSLFSQDWPSQFKLLSQPNQMLRLSFDKSIQNTGFNQLPGFNGCIQPRFNSWKIAPPAIKWQATSRWRSIQEIYILKHRVFNELILNEKRLNLA